MIPGVIAGGASAVAGGGGTSAHRYWSMKMLTPASQGEFAVGELRMATSVGGTNIALISAGATPIGTPSSYGVPGSGYSYDSAFDGNAAGYYQPGAAASVGAYVGSDFGTPVAIVEYRMINTSVANYMPTNWEFRYSDDGTTWTVCDTRTSESFVDGVERSFTITPAVGSSGAGWNPADSSPNAATYMVFSDSDRVAQKTESTVDVTTRGVVKQSSGKWYAEVNCTEINSLGVSSGTFMVGIIDGAEVLANNWLFQGNAVYYRGNGDVVTPSGGFVSSIGVYTTGDVIGVALDADTGKVWFSLNGVFSGDPVAATGSAATVSASTFGLVFSAGNGSVDQIATINNASGSQTYSPPSGFTAWGSVVGNPETFDPAAITGPGVTLTNANRTFNSEGAGATGNARGLHPKSTGKWQFEIYVASDPDIYAILGFAETGTSTTSYPGFHSTSYGYWNRNGNIYNANASVAYGAGFAPGATIGCVLDLDARTAEFFKEGVSQGSFSIASLTGSIVPMVGNGGGSGAGLILELNQFIDFPVSGATQWDDI